MNPGIAYGRYWSVLTATEPPPRENLSSAKFTARRSSGLSRKSGLEALNASSLTVKPGLTKKRSRLIPYFWYSGPSDTSKNDGATWCPQSASFLSILMTMSRGDAARRSTSKRSTWCGRFPP